jgi:hypothetical protein
MFGNLGIPSANDQFLPGVVVRFKQWRWVCDEKGDGEAENQGLNAGASAAPVQPSAKA